jgi:hypothetical protein
MKIIVGTGKNPQIPKGQKYRESDDVAAIVVKKGEATYLGDVKDEDPNKATSEEVKTGDKSGNENKK